MFSILRPFLFNLDPETAHNFAINSLKFNPLPEKVFEVHDEQMLNIELLGKKFPNPIGLAAGFDKNAVLYNELADFGFGFIEIGTITPLAQPGNSKPRIFRFQSQGAIVNRLGFNNKGVDYLVEKAKKRSFPGIWRTVRCEGSKRAAC